jgi:chlorophyll(ide) b reductase
MPHIKLNVYKTFATTNPSKNVVITGGSRGLGKSLARSFLKQGDTVFLMSRNIHELRETVYHLQDYAPCERIHYMPGDVSKMKYCQELKEKALTEMGSIDVWINNAGTNCYVTKPFTSYTDKEINDVINTNIYGTVYCSKIMIDVMKEQQKGLLVNVEGAGSNGFPTPNHALYGMTKQGITHFTKTLMYENIDAPYNICTISPGMILTDMLLSDESNTGLKHIFNIICEEPDFIADYLVDKINKVSRHEQIRYLTVLRILWLYLLSIIRKERHFDKFGNKK